MKIRPHNLAILIVGFSFFTAVAFVRSGVFAQVTADTKVTRIEPKTVKIVESSSRFAPAAMENARLRSSMKWAFGRAQTGWEIYTDLICHTIETDAKPDTPEFAMAVSRWQIRNGQTPTGIIDNDTFDALVKGWQSQRIGKSWNYPDESVLYNAPIADFYDQTRDAELLKLDSVTYIAYKKMVLAAAKDLKGTLKVTPKGDLAPEEKYLKIVSAFRSREYQAQLRRKEPNAGRAALAMNSPHSSGFALDIYVGGKPVSTKDENRLIQVQTPAYKWLVKNAHKFGFYNYFYEPWHWEYVRSRAAK
jgi:D-alanyl-D-alanine carboxypeptidase